MDRSDLARSAALGIVAFAATILVLGGLLAIVGRQPGDAGSSASPTSAAGATASPPSPWAPSPTPTRTPIPDATLVGAGDIAGCDWETDEATAALLDDLEGTIFTAGDNVYPQGTDETYAACFDPSWGRHLDRIRPAIGNHDTDTGSSRAYLDYFGAAAVNEDGDPWYAYDLAAWRIIVLDSDRCEDGGCAPDTPQGR